MCPEWEIRQPFKLLHQCNIFQADAFGIGKVAALGSNASAGNSNVNIYVDSHVTIKAITSFYISARSVFESRAAVESVARNTTSLLLGARS